MLGKNNCFLGRGSTLTNYLIPRYTKFLRNLKETKQFENFHHILNQIKKIMSQITYFTLLSNSDLCSLNINQSCSKNEPPNNSLPSNSIILKFLSIYMQQEIRLKNFIFLICSNGNKNPQETFLASFLNSML